jgi:hypothetical protein
MRLTRVINNQSSLIPLDVYEASIIIVCFEGLVFGGLMNGYI